jgi:membrane-associated phospholipid phosphatase
MGLVSLSAGEMVTMSQKPMHERLHTMAEDATQEVVASRRPWYAVGKVARILFGLYALFLVLFGTLAWWVRSSPVLPLDVTITRTLQEDRAPWLRVVMLAISFLGSALVLWPLILLAAVLFWLAGLRLEAITLVTLSAISKGLNVVLKVLVARPRPTSRLVSVFQVATGQSFPSEHVMAYLAFWGLLFCFGIILFQGKHWWRILLLVVCATLVVLVGPSRIYLGDHWASDVMGSYLIGGVLLGVTLWVYLKLKERGILETKSMRERTVQSEVLRSFPPK